MSSYIICQKCGTKNSANAAVCKSCKTSLGMICSKCGQLNSALLNYCEDCGTELPPRGVLRTKNPLEQESEFEAERLHLNILFCDMVGSTELSETLDPEEFRDLVVEYQEVCAK